jgi:hypothetical protein
MLHGNYFAVDQETEMMPVMRISDRTWERLKAYARPLEDTADDVVNRAIDALDLQSNRVTSPKPVQERQQSNAVTQGEKIPQKELRAPLLETLAQLGGKAGLKDIKEAMEPKLKARLSKADYELVSTGEERWWNAVCWVRSDLVKEGLLTKTSPRGIWELSRKTDIR